MQYDQPSMCGCYSSAVLVKILCECCLLSIILFVTLEGWGLDSLALCQMLLKRDNSQPHRHLHSLESVQLHCRPHYW